MSAHEIIDDSAMRVCVCVHTTLESKINTKSPNGTLSSTSCQTLRSFGGSVECHNTSIVLQISREWIRNVGVRLLETFQISLLCSGRDAKSRDENNAENDMSCGARFLRLGAADAENLEREGGAGPRRSRIRLWRRRRATSLCEVSFA